MAIAQHMTILSFDTRITDLATATTLGAATRHDFSAKTLYVPETTSRTFRSVIAKGSLKLQGTNVDLDGLRIGIKINAVAFDDEDTTWTVTNSGEQWTVEWSRDVTAYFATNDPGTASFSVQVGVACATGSAANVNMITAQVEATYDFDDGATTLTAFAMFPVQSHHTYLTTAATYYEVGTTGGTAGTNAPANQIRQLTGAGGFFENVTGFALRSRHLVITGSTRPNGVGVQTPTYRFDGAGTTYTRAPGDNTTGTANAYRDIFDIGASGANLSTTAAHSWEVSSDTAVTFEHLGAIDLIVYEYTASSTVQPVCAIVPLESVGGDATLGTTSGASTNPDRLVARLNIQEPDTIVDGPMGVVIFDGMTGNGPSLNVYAEGQTPRPYVHSNTVRDGINAIVHRCDHSSSAWTLRRGANDLVLDIHASTITANTFYTGYAIINYLCGKPAGGATVRTRHVRYQRIAFSSTLVQVVQSPAAPTIPHASYHLVGAMAYAATWNTGAQQGSCFPERIATDPGGVYRGWYRHAAGVLTDMNELASQRQLVALRCFKAHPDGTGADVTAARDWMGMVSTQSGHHAGDLWLTYNAITHTVAGTVTIGGSPASNGKTVEVYAKHKQRTAPRLRSVSLKAADVGAITPTMPDHANGTVALLFVETQGDQAAPTLSTPAGFAQIATYADTTAGATGTRLTVFWKRCASSNDGDPTVADSGDHQLATIACFDGCVPSGNPWDAYTGDDTTAGGASTTATIPGPTTTVDECLVVVAVSNGSAWDASAWTNANLVAGPYERFDDYYGGGGNGGLAIATGVKRAAGAVGNTTATMGASVRQARIAIALKGIDPNGATELISTTTTSGGTGAFSTSVPDDTRDYFVSYANDTDYGRSASGTPGVSTFDVTIGGSGGGNTYSRSRVVNPV